MNLVQLSIVLHLDYALTQCIVINCWTAASGQTQLLYLNGTTLICLVIEISRIMGDMGVLWRVHSRPETLLKTTATASTNEAAEGPSTALDTVIDTNDIELEITETTIIYNNGASTATTSIARRVDYQGARTLVPHWPRVISR